jgi:hypothetical protein
MWTSLMQATFSFTRTPPFAVERSFASLRITELRRDAVFTPRNAIMGGQGSGRADHLTGRRGSAGASPYLV